MQRIKIPVEEFTTPDPITAQEGMSIADVRQLMEQHGIRHLPVVRDDVVVGIISDRDVRLLSGLTPAEKDQVSAADVMAVNPLSVFASDTLDDVAYTMSENKVGSVIVNEANGKFLGIFTATDALNALIEIVRSGGEPAL
jgi:acetoin utilization protein AcuB